jgi:RNA polymerase sigma-70 factor (ECF subfamily)
MQAEGDVVRLPVAQEGPLDFATFFADEHRELFRLLCFVTGNRADAADLMQDAFLKLWERWDRVERIADPRAYLFRVALNGSRRRTRAALRAARPVGTDRLVA